MNYPTFRYDMIAPATYRVLDAHTSEVYGAVYPTGPMGWCYSMPGMPPGIDDYPTRDEAARALYRARHAHGFEAGAL